MKYIVLPLYLVFRKQTFFYLVFRAASKYFNVWILKC